jgi:hypothetical protein
MEYTQMYFMALGKMDFVTGQHDWMSNWLYAKIQDTEFNKYLHMSS